MQDPAGSGNCAPETVYLSALALPADHVQVDNIREDAQAGRLTLTALSHLDKKMATNANCFK
jgi:hypothetical protein